MRMNELSRRSGLPVSTIKYYLRERMLPPGHATGANQAVYGEEHLRRLRLIRTLLEIGGLSTAVVREVLAELGSSGAVSRRVLASLRTPQVAAHQGERDDQDDVAAAQVAAFLERRGWPADPDHPAVRTLVTAVRAARAAGDREFADRLDLHADAALKAVEAELAALAPVERAGEVLVVSCVLGDVVQSAVRGLAHEHLLGAGEADQSSAERGVPRVSA